MRQFEYQIKDKFGLHARPAGLLVKLANQFTSKITVRKGDSEVEARRLLSLMSLCIKQGETVYIIVDGEDEAKACQELKLFFEENL